MLVFPFCPLEAADVGDILSDPTIIYNPFRWHGCSHLQLKRTLLVQVTLPNTNVPIEELPAPSYRLEKEICIAIKWSISKQSKMRTKHFNYLRRLALIYYVVTISRETSIQTASHCEVLAIHFLLRQKENETVWSWVQKTVPNILWPALGITFQLNDANRNHVLSVLLLMNGKASCWSYLVEGISARQFPELICSAPL